MTKTFCFRSAPAAVLAAAALMTISPRLSRADAPPADAAAGEALFREGRRLAKAGDLAGACAKFEESHRLDPAVGTLANLADCEEKLGRLASAWEHWRWTVDRLPAGDRRRTTALARVAALEQTVPRLTVLVAGEQPEGLTIKRDGVALGPASHGLALPLDPGPHQVVVTAPGRRPLTYDVTVAGGEQRRLEVAAGPAQAGGPIAMASDSSPVQPGPLVTAVAATTTGPATALSATAPPPASHRWRRTAGYTLLGVGAAGLAAGTWFGLEALSARKDARRACNGAGAPPGCWSSARDPLVRDRYYSWRADASLAAGAIAVLTGGYLLFTGRQATPVTVGAAPAPGGGEVAVAARF